MANLAIFTFCNSQLICKIEYRQIVYLNPQMAAQHKNSRTKYERANEEPVLTDNRLSLLIMRKLMQLQSLNSHDAALYPDMFSDVLQMVEEFIIEVYNYSLQGDINILFNKLITLYNEVHAKHFS